MSPSRSPPAAPPARSGRAYPHFDDLAETVKPGALPERASIKAWLDEGRDRLRRAQFSKNWNRADNAYTDFMIAAEIALTIIPKNKEYPTFCSATNSKFYNDYLDFKKEVAGALKSGDIDKLKNQIKENNQMWGTKPSLARELHSNAGIGATGNGIPQPPEPNGAEDERSMGSNTVNKRAPPPPPSKPVGLSGYRPFTDGKSHTAPMPSNTNRTTSPVPREQAEIMARFEKLRPKSTPKQPTTSLTTGQLGGNGTVLLPINRGRSPGINPPLLPPKLDTSISSGLPRPPSPTYSPARNSISPPRSMPVKSKKSQAMVTLTNETLLSPSALESYITRSAEINVLLLDVRNRGEYEEGHIPAKSIVCVEPLSLRQGMSGDQLEESFLISPSASEHGLFAKRNTFDLVVYYDQSTLSNDFLTQNTDNEKHVHLQRLHQALCDFSFQKPLQHPPVLLKGGLDAWIADFGPSSLSVPASQNSTQTSAVGLGITNITQPAQPIRKKISREPNSKKEVQTQRPSDIDDERAWFESLQNNREPLTISVPRDSENMDVKRQRRSTSIVSGERDAPPISITDLDYPRTLEQFFQKFPAIPIQQSMMTPIPGTPTNADMSTPTTPGFSAKRNTILDHPFYGFTDVRTPDLNPLSTPSRPAPAVPRKSYKGESEKPIVRPLPEQTLALKGAPQNGSPFHTGKIGGINFGATGLKNLGNTCYMNSILQCMNGTLPLSRYFMDGSYKLHVNKDNVLGSGGTLAEAFANVVRHLWEGRYKFISPMTFKEVSGRLNEMFKTNDQQDSQEFLEFLLDGLHEDLNPNASRNQLRELTPEEEANRESLPVPIASFHEWRRYTHRNSSVIVNWFQGQLSSRLTCLTCNTQSTTYNAFTYISLPIPPKKNPTILDCMEEFCREEILEKDDAWHCPTCKKARKATKKLTITRLPMVLIIHIKRFTNKGPWRDKLNTPIDYPLRDLELSKYVLTMTSGNEAGGNGFQLPPEQTPPFVYDLYGVCNHYGTLNGGHYTSFVRNSYDEVWNLFDDSKVSKVSTEEVVSKNAYVLFWVRSHVI
ncbi:hypothetical protein DFH27DRAFT_608193 [Peziza echinospora]|nr:hypothetical protein DFH27DRAFT_608193 [Peziza echinospora]